jgi:cystathionine gamma-lyase
MAAEATLLALLSAGDHILCHDDLYGGTYRLLSKITAKQGIEVEFANMRDLEAVAELARPRKVLTVCDNTFLSPYFQRPPDLGIDIALHSTTKYINGHSDVVGGAIVVKDEGLAEQFYFHQNALKIARWLETHPKVSRVLHPGLESHPQHDLARRQMRGFGGTFSFRLRGGKDAVSRLLSGVRIFALAESLGGVESLIEHPRSMTHLSMPEEVRTAAGITDDLIRLSVGIEHVDDLKADLEQALG